MKFENTNVYNFENALRGMRNPKQSWDRSDSIYGSFVYKDLVGKDRVNSKYFNLHCKTILDIKKFLTEHDFEVKDDDDNSFFEFIVLDKVDQNSNVLSLKPLDPDTQVYNIKSLIRPGPAKAVLYIIKGEIINIGPNDLGLAQTLIKAGSVHRKFLRQIFVSVDITAPLYWWKEFDTYKVGTVANSTSTMHTMLKQPITADCFEKNELDHVIFEGKTQDVLKKWFNPKDIDMSIFDCQYMNYNIEVCERLRKQCLILLDRLSENDKLITALSKSNGNNPEIESKIIPYSQVEVIQKAYEALWKRLIIRLPESWLQKRTVTFNYETLYSICRPDSRLYHKLNEWSGRNNNNMENFISWCKTLPYSEEFLFLKN